MTTCEQTDPTDTNCQRSGRGRATNQKDMQKGNPFSEMMTDTAGDTLSPSESILYEIAEHTGESPGELNPPLFDVVDPGALNAVFRGDSGHISFEYHGYTVTVDHTGNVNLETTNAD